METRRRSDGLTLIAVYHFICGLVSLLVVCGVATLPLISGLAATASNDPAGGPSTAIMGIIAVVVGGVFALIAAANLAMGWGLWQRREWARVGAIALAVLRLINIPLGTVIGVLIIWYLLRDDVKPEFAS